MSTARGQRHTAPNAVAVPATAPSAPVVAPEPAKRHTISILVENRFGAFMRVAGMFAAKGYNLESIAVGRTDEPDISRMTVVTRGEDAVIEQIIRQLDKLIDTITVVDLTFQPYVERELALVKVHCTTATRPEIMQIAEIFRAKVVDLSPRSVTMETTGGQDKVDAIIRMLRPFKILELARTGRVALKREYQREA